MGEHGSMNSRTEPVGAISAPGNPDPVNLRIDPEIAWQQVLARDCGANFFYGVTTTGIFCRPSCSSRRPLRANVRFFATAEAASAAGFRACRVCGKAQAPLQQIREFIEANLERPVRLVELGRIGGLSPFTAQRLFKREMGVSPLAYQRALRARLLRKALKRGEPVTDAIYEAGFGSSSRAYEDAGLGMTPARFAKGGRGERIGYTTAQTRFGWLVVGATGRGLCWLALAASKADAEKTLREEFPAAELHREPSLAGWVGAAVAGVCAGGNRDAKIVAPKMPGPLDLRGTAFQLRVWQALRRIPRGETRSYSQLARELGNPDSVRAVARACATNRVALVVPCHRVVGADQSLTGYRWGIERKRQLLAAERA